MPTLFGTPESAEALAIAHLLRTSPTVVYLAVNDRAAEETAACLPFFAPHVRVLRLPAWDCLPYDRTSPRPALVAARVRALAALAEGFQGVVLTTASAWAQKVPPRAWLQARAFSVRAGDASGLDALAARLEAAGYRRMGKAVEPGEYARRGGIIDVMLPGEAQGLRLDFFGDTLEALRTLDPITQKSGDAVPAATFYPAGELVLDAASIQRFREAYRTHFGAVSREDVLYDSVSAGQHYPGVEHWLPLFHEQLETLRDYVPGAALLWQNQVPEALEERRETIRDYFQARQAAAAQKSHTPYHPLPPEALYQMHEAGPEPTQLSPFAGEPSLEARAVPSLVSQRAGQAANPFDQLVAHAAAKRAEGKATLLACESAGSCERLKELLAKHGADTSSIEQWDAAARARGIGLAVLPLAHGFETPAVAVLSEQDVLGDRVIRSAARKKRSAEFFLAEAANFQEGEHVVHREHGIGRFDGLVTLEVQGARHDCLKLTYTGDDRLFVPVENIDVLTRFGAEDEAVVLDKLGAASWQARKSKMKERITLAAEVLMKTAAERLSKSAPSLAPESGAYAEFCARFGYAETEDQERAIAEVLEDLHTGTPMDRLVCGDVGFGKTEVALRAAFAAVSSPTVPPPGGGRLGGGLISTDRAWRPPPQPGGGSRPHPNPPPAGEGTQVAVIVPTTLLARQHYKNFAERFAGMGVEVRQLSRMASAADQKKTREMLADGRAQIVVGTHALLGKGVQFANLGLLIIDEEQHFGVAQKEKLKSLKADVHVLTLTATPIPRTLHMAMSGIRSLSLITTPPVDRLAVRSFVMPWDGVVLREALLREKHRSGRVFFVTPKIRDLGDLKAKLAELVPEMTVGLAHGQMTPADLDAVMNAFYDGAYDILLSTAIIESGLDIPQANTIIIHRADRFGLAQLYQMRGRVGRGKQRAYAYFLLPTGKELTRQATRRLEVMQSLDELGAGFTLASHDMDIRGCGNLVGEEQSGHIREVGVELYQQMLEEAVQLAAASRQRSESKDNLVTDRRPLAAGDWSPQINLGLSVLIPAEYVEDLPLRMGLYRRAGALSTEAEIDAFAAELVDRFGPLPEEVKHLLSVVRVKQLCRAAGVARVDAGPKGAVFSFYQDRFAAPEKLLAYVMKHPTTLKLRPDQKLVLMGQAGEGEVSKVLEDIGKLGVIGC